MIADEQRRQQPLNERQQQALLALARSGGVAAISDLCRVGMLSGKPTPWASSFWVLADRGCARSVGFSGGWYALTQKGIEVAATNGIVVPEPLPAHDEQVKVHVPSPEEESATSVQIVRYAAEPDLDAYGYDWNRRGWHIEDAASEPTCKTCLRLLPQARERAARMVEPVLDPDQWLVVKHEWVRPSFSPPRVGRGQVAIAPDVTFWQLAELLFEVEVQEVAAAINGYEEDFDEHPVRFDLARGVTVIPGDTIDLGYGDALTEPLDRTVASVFAAGTEGIFTWDLGTCWTLKLRAETISAEEGARLGSRGNRVTA